MPPRKAPMRRGHPGAAGATLRTGAPRRPLPARSSKRTAEDAIRGKLFAPYRGTRCRIGAPPCTGRAEHFHELVGRAQTGSVVDPRNLVPACDLCNGWIEDNPTAALAASWKVVAWESTTIRGDGGLVPATASPLAIASDVDRWDA